MLYILYVCTFIQYYWKILLNRKIDYIDARFPLLDFHIALSLFRKHLIYILLTDILIYINNKMYINKNLYVDHKDNREKEEEKRE